MLKTAGEVAELRVETDRTALPADGGSLAFVKVWLADKEGNINRWKKEKITVEIEGDASLQGFGNANPSCEGSYQDCTWSTYDGVVMAVVRAGRTPGKAEVRFKSESGLCGNVFLELNKV